MSISKRVLALAAAGVAALVLGGSVGVFHHDTTTLAGAPTNGAIGCAATSANIIFPTTVAGATGTINGQQVPQSAINGSTNAQGNGFLNPLAPTTPITCGALFQDSGAGNATTGGDTDLNVNTVDGGTITYTVSGPVSILQSNATVYSVNCGATTPGEHGGVAVHQPTRPARVPSRPVPAPS